MSFPGSAGLSLRDPRREELTGCTRTPGAVKPGRNSSHPKEEEQNRNPVDANSAVIQRVPEGGARAAVRAEKIRKVYASGTAEIVVLDGVDLEVQRGEMVALVGASGTGKSTLLHLLAALDTPTNGAIYFDGVSLGSLGENELTRYRNRAVGFLWQRHHLLPDFSAVENVAMPLWVRGGAPLDGALDAAKQWLAEVGLSHRAGHRAGELSGGEQQRVAIARALAGGPSLLLADEPTGDLDESNAAAVFDLFARLHRTHGLTSVLATHNPALASSADRILRLAHGVLMPEPGALRSEGNRG